MIRALSVDRPFVATAALEPVRSPPEATRSVDARMPRPDAQQGGRSAVAALLASLVPPQAQPRQLMGCPDDVLREVLRWVSAEDLHNARSACKDLGRVGLEPSLPGWEGLLNQAIRRAKTADQVVAMLRQAADRGVLQHVRTLDLRGKDLRAEHVEAICGLFSGLECVRLEHLDLAVNQSLGNGAAKALASAPALASLRSLNLRYAGMDGEGVRTLLSASHLSALEFLHLGSNKKMGLAVGEALRDAPHLTRLTKLTLSDTGLDDAGMRALAAAAHLGSLRELDLSCNRLAGGAAWALAAATQFAQLEKLELEGNQLGPEIPAAFVTAVHLSALKELNLSTNDWWRFRVTQPGLTDRMVRAKHFEGCRFIM